MKRILMILSFFATVGVFPVAADVGVGVILGSPTGISALFGNRVAVAAAWNIPSERVHLHADVWLLRQRLVDPVDWYLGAGGKVQFASGNSDDVRAGVRIPLGLQWYALPRLELFAEIVPGMQLIPSTGFDLDGGVGIRFHL
jgi:hypothetical protein